MFQQQSSGENYSLLHLLSHYRSDCPGKVKHQDTFSGLSAFKEEKRNLPVFLGTHSLQSMLCFQNLRTEVRKYFLILKTFLTANITAVILPSMCSSAPVPVM